MALAFYCFAFSGEKDENDTTLSSIHVVLRRLVFSRIGHSLSLFESWPEACAVACESTMVAADRKSRYIGFSFFSVAFLPYFTLAAASRPYGRDFWLARSYRVGRWVAALVERSATKKFWPVILIPTRPYMVFIILFSETKKTFLYDFFLFHTVQLTLIHYPALRFPVFKRLNTNLIIVL